MADEARHASTTSQPAVAFKPRNLVVLSDGTGNSSAKLFRTNVWRIYEALDLNCVDQVALYDNGVGTGSFKPLAALGGAFGYGLKRNVLELYTFLCRNYQAVDGYEYDPSKAAAETAEETARREAEESKQHDHIFAFGFSRGAFTARVVAGLVANQGLIRRKTATSDKDLTRLAKWAYRAYRVNRYRNSPGVRLLRMLRNGLLRFKDLLFRNKPYDPAANRKVSIDFLGVFDTVAAYGLPIDELTHGWDKWIWPMLPEDSSLNERVRYARHALAIDDERQTFFPLLWDEDSQKEIDNKAKFRHADNRITQVWFAGMHSNVGGGYADDALSHGPLCWMAGEATAQGLRFQSHMLRSGGTVPCEWLERAAPCAPMSDSRHGVGAYYRYHPRPIGRLSGLKDHSSELNRKAKVRIDRPKIHESVFERIRDGRDNYAPFALPEKYAVVTRKGEVLYGDGNPKDPKEPKAPPANPFEHTTQAESRLNEQQKAWNAVWWRRVVYFLTIGATLLVLALPFIPLPDVADEVDSYAPLRVVVDLLGTFVPSFAQGWLDEYRQHPGWLLFGLLVVGLLLYLGSWLRGEIGRRMVKVWTSHGLTARPIKVEDKPDGLIYKLRTSPAYVGWFRFQSDHVWPNFFGVVIAAVLFIVIPIRLAYEYSSRSGYICNEHDGSGAMELGFYPSEMCHATGITIEKGQKYAIQIAIPDPKEPCGVSPPTEDTPLTLIGPWYDRTIPVTPLTGASPTWPMRLFTPFRRVWPTGWYVPVATIGQALPERHYLTTSPYEFVAARTGRLYFFVNDAAGPFGCWGWKCLYGNNHGGEAKVRVTKLDPKATVASLREHTPYTCDDQRRMIQGR